MTLQGATGRRTCKQARLIRFLIDQVHVSGMHRDSSQAPSLPSGTYTLLRKRLFKRQLYM